MRTGNLAAVTRTMGHRDVQTAMHYQHPELDVVRAALDYSAASHMLGRLRSRSSFRNALLLPLPDQPVQHHRDSRKNNQLQTPIENASKGLRLALPTHSEFFQLGRVSFFGER